MMAVVENEQIFASDSRRSRTLLGVQTRAKGPERQTRRCILRVMWKYLKGKCRVVCSFVGVDETPDCGSALSRDDGKIAIGGLRAKIWDPIPMRTSSRPRLMLSDKGGGGFNDNNDKETWMQWTLVRDKGAIMNCSG